MFPSTKWQASKPLFWASNLSQEWWFPPHQFLLTGEGHYWVSQTIAKAKSLQLRGSTWIADRTFKSHTLFAIS